MPERYFTQFWLRKLHSLTGAVFLGYFLSVHVVGVGGYKTLFARVAFFYLPLAFHGLYGLFVIYESQPNNINYPYWRNWVFLFQRITGFVLIPFIFLHLADMKGWSDLSSLGWYKPIWYAGMLAAVFHFVNGFFGAMIEWGITVGPHSQRVMVILCFLGFLVLGALGVHTLYVEF